MNDNFKKNKMKYLLVPISFVLLLLNFAWGQNLTKTYSVKIKINNEASAPGDTLILQFGTYDPIEGRISQYQNSVVNSNHEALFSFEQPFPYGYLRIYKNKQLYKTDYLTLVDNLFWEQGDDIIINISQPKTLEKRTYLYDTKFEGKSAAKYYAIYAIKQKEDEIIRDQRNYRIKTTIVYDAFDFSLNKNPVLQSECLKTLDIHRPSLSELCYEVLKTEIQYWDHLAVESKLNDVPNRLNELDKDKAASVLKDLKEKYLPLQQPNVSLKAMAASYNLVSFYSTLFYVISLIDPNSNDQAICEFIISNSHGELQEALLTAFMAIKGYSSTSINTYRLIEQQLQHPYYINVFRQIKSNSNYNLNHFSLLNLSGKEVSLSSFNGKIILFDVWFTGCGGCIHYRNEVLKKLESRFRNDPRFSIVSICSDKNTDMWKKALKLNTYANPDGINLYSGPIGSGTLFMKTLGIIGAPTALLVNKNGDIIEFNTPVLHDADQLTNLIKSLM